MTKQFVVLAMHRSFSSGVAQGLHKVGVNMGDTMLGKSRSQPQGHWEDREFLRLDESILKALNGSWKQPPSQAAIEAAAPEYSSRIRRMIAARNEANDMWGFKDPRTAVLWPLYRPHFHDDTHLVAVFRRPSKVAESLHSRNGMPVEQAVKLADYHNRLILLAATEFVGAGL